MTAMAATESFQAVALHVRRAASRLLATNARRPRRGCALFLVDQLGETPQRQSIALRPQPRDDAVRAQRYVGMVAERLALVDIGNVHLEDWDFARVQRVQNRDRRMRESGWIDHDAAGGLAGFVDPVDDFIFAVTLVEANFELQFRSGRHAVALDVSQRLIAVNMRLAFTQQVEVGAVQHEDSATHKHP